MRIVFLSNYFNHHQKPFCDEMYQLVGNDFCFIETKPMEEERLKMGWGESVIPSYVYRTYQDNQICQKKINGADIVIKGSAPESLLANAKKNKKIIFRYSERPLRHGIEIFKYLPRFFKWHYNNPFRCPIYMLCASAYTAIDYRKFGLFRNKTFKWGYFTAFKEYTNVQDLILKKKKNSILWVARFLKLKHPEYVIELGKFLRDKGYFFDINMIGAGEQENEIKQMILDYGLNDCIHLLGTMTPLKVRECMEQSEIFIFTSDQQEGWGAVMNESMNSACAVVADKRIGSVPFLIKSGENGFSYDSLSDFIGKVEKILNDDDLKNKVSTNAYKTICDLWNPHIAAQRFLKLCTELQSSKKSNLFFEGPCSQC